MRRLLLLPVLAYILTTNATAATWFLTVAGLGGTPEYDKQFNQWADEFERALKANGAECHNEMLRGATATKAGIHDALTRLSGQVSASDAFALVLIGHGTFDGAEYKFNVPGPDVTAAELASLLNRIPAERQLVANMTSASGASLSAFARKNRIVITATKSGTEKNVTVFARYWIEGLQNLSADTDKNGSVSALEAYKYAEAKTAAYYQSEKLLATEHSMLDDTGASEGAREPSAANGQGLRAASFAIVKPVEGTVAAANPAKRDLLTRRDQLESQIDQLKYEKAAMPSDEYKRRLADLLMQLARTQAEIDR